MAAKRAYQLQGAEHFGARRTYDLVQSWDFAFYERPILVALSPKPIVGCIRESRSLGETSRDSGLIEPSDLSSIENLNYPTGPEEAPPCELPSFFEMFSR